MLRLALFALLAIDLAVKLFWGGDNIFGRQLSQLEIIFGQEKLNSEIN